MGDDKKEFTVHRSFAIKSSKFLQAALKNDSRWKEAQEKRVALPEAKPVDFEVYLERVYSSQLAPREAETPEELGTMLVRLYILGDFLDDARFCNRVMDVFSPGADLHAIWGFWVLGDIAFSLAWAKTSVGSPLRTALLRNITHNIVHREGQFQTLLKSSFPRELLLDLFQHLESKHRLTHILRPSTKLSAAIPGCAYHRHDEENPKCSESK